MNRLIAEGKMDEALRLVKETIALPAILGYICPAPCEKACRRKDIDEPLSICMLKRFVAEEDLFSDFSYKPILKPSRNQKVAIIGSGPAGLAASFHLAKEGFECHVYDSHILPGGKLRTDITNEILPEKVLDAEIDRIRSLQVEFFQNQSLGIDDIIDKLSSKYSFILWMAGADTIKWTEYLEQTTLSSNKDLQIFCIKQCHLFVPKQIPSKSKMAVRSVGLGRKSSDWIMEFIETQHVSAPSRIFNSIYKPITTEEQTEFLKEAQNSFHRETTPEKLQGFSKEKAIKEAGRCLHCDCRKKESCVLRNLSTDYKASQRVYLLASHKKITKNTEHVKLVFENLKCIKCGICIQTAQRQGEKTGFAFYGRGFDVKVAIPIEKSISELTDETAILCAGNCPTGAISLKSVTV